MSGIVWCGTVRKNYVEHAICHVTIDSFILILASEIPSTVNT